MYYRFTRLLFALWWAPLTTCSMNNSPVCVVHTPNSILQNPTGYVAGKVGSRTRYATCTGAAWFHGNYLATLNLYGQKLITYRFDEAHKKFYLMQEIKQAQPVQFYHPEALAVSPDGTLLALCDNHPGTSKIHIYAINPENHLIDPRALYSLLVQAFVHNVRFTPDGNYLAYATFSNQMSICLHKIERDGTRIFLEHVHTHINTAPLLKAKGINFTHDGNYAVIAYALSIATSEQNPLQSLVAIHTFDATKGSLGALVSSVTGTFSFEDLTFLNDDRIIALPDQAGDQIILYPFDPTTGQINPHYALIKNPEARLSFPHGVAASPDGNYLVATNYGTDTFNVYHIN